MRETGNRIVALHFQTKKQIGWSLLKRKNSVLIIPFDKDKILYTVICQVHYLHAHFEMSSSLIPCMMLQIQPTKMNQRIHCSNPMHRAQTLNFLPTHAEIIVPRPPRPGIQLRIRHTMATDLSSLTQDFLQTLPTSSVTFSAILYQLVSMYF